MSDKAHENKLRRMADRQGLMLQKSRTRDRRALTYGGYQLVDEENGEVVLGQGNIGRGYASSLEEVESYLNRSRARLTREEIRQREPDLGALRRVKAPRYERRAVS